MMQVLSFKVYPLGQILATIETQLVPFHVYPVGQVAAI